MAVPQQREPVSVPSPAATTTSRTDQVRRDRDRFLAFAFCAADILVELDGKHRISFVAGASMALTGKNSEALVGSPFVELVAPPDRNLIVELLRGLKPGMRINSTRVRFNGPQGRQIALSLFGYQLAEVSGAYYFALRIDAALNGGEGRAITLRRDPQTGLLDTDSFAESAAVRVREAAQTGETLSLTVVRLGDLAQMKQKLSRDDQESMMTTVGATLRAESAGGDCAARVDESNYSLVHAAELDIKELRARLMTYLKSLDPSSKGVAVEVATVADAAAMVSGADETRAMMYALGRICETALDGGGDHSGAPVSDMVREASERMKLFRRIVRNDEAQLAFQPVVEIASRRIRHFEVLARFSKDIGGSPYESIQFAESVGMICDFDFNMCRRALAWLDERRKVTPGKHYAIAVNLSGRSVANVAFLDSLHALFKQHEPVRKQVALEITESASIRDLAAANKFIQSLREAGHEVCLDDFGTGASALAYLHALEVDVVKIAGEYVRGAVGDRKYRSMLKAMGSLCAELGVLTIAEMVEDATYLLMLKECGIPLAQGYHFGRPSFDVRDFDAVSRH